MHLNDKTEITQTGTQLFALTRLRALILSHSGSLSGSLAGTLAPAGHAAARNATN